MRALSLMAALTTLCGPAWSEPRQACRVEAFAGESVADQETNLARRCGGDHLDWQLATPRANPLDAGPSLLHARLDSVMSERLAPNLLASLRFGWAGSRAEEAGRLQTERTTLAAGSMLRLGSDFALQMNLGRELAGEPRNRATVAGIWQPVRSGLAFLEWAGSQEGTEMHRLGARWWLLPQRVTVDVASRLPPQGGQWEEPSVGLQLRLPY